MNEPAASPKELLAAVCAEFKTTEEELRSPCRKRRLVFARMAYAVIRRKARATVRTIGCELNRKHSTIIRLLEYHKYDCKYYPPYAKKYESTINRLREQKKPE